ncbi:MAG: HRDC domain-containing protein, partial [Solirubrobacteraceae bacterium]
TGQTCRRRQILDHFGDREPCAPEGRCCDVCEPDAELVAASRRAAPAASRARGASARGSGTRAASDGSRALAGVTGAIGAAGANNGAGARAPANGSGTDGEPVLDPVDEGQFEKLKAWRLGRSEGKPAYTVAANAALEGVLRARPTNLDELIEVKGIGPTFCERHGESLLATLAEL